MRQAWHVKVTYVQEILAANLGGNDHLVDPYVNDGTIFQWTITKANDSAGSGEGQVVGSCEHDNERSNCVKCIQFLTILTVVKTPKLQMFP